MAVTIYDIAEKLETSHSTVSRALRNDSKIAFATCRQVKKQALKMGYRPNLLDRAFNGPSKNTEGG